MDVIVTLARSFWLVHISYQAVLLPLLCSYCMGSRRPNSSLVRELLNITLADTILGVKLLVC
jgi:hypothetical protein